MPSGARSEPDPPGAEHALRESEARFRALFSAIDEGYCLCDMILDPEGRPVDYRFLELNPHFEEMTGLVGAAGRTAYEMVPGLERRWVETYAEVALGGEPLRFEDGSEAMGRWFDVFATPVEPRGRFALVFKDITDRKRAEAAVRERELAERRARRQAELLGELASRLEPVEEHTARIRELLALLVPRVADYATIETPGDVGGVIAVAHRDAPSNDTLRALRDRQRGRPDRPDPLWRSVRGAEQLIAVVPSSVIETYGEDPEAAALLEALGPRSHLAVPLDIGSGPQAVLTLGLGEPGRRPYEPGDVAFVRRVADRAGVIFARARGRDEEHVIARRLQEALLPVAVLDRPGVEIAARYHAATVSLEVGGDFYDTFALAGGEIAVVVGDVVGHGIESAVAMGQLRTALTALAAHADGPGRLLSHLDAFVAATGVPYATLACAFLDPSTGRMRYASAGHPPMLVVSEGGAARWLDEGRSPPLYPGAGHPRPEATVVLEPGATLVAYSDGLVERREESLEDGLARLEAVVRDAASAPAGAICDRLVAAFDADRARDDVVVLALRRII